MSISNKMTRIFCAAVIHNCVAKFEETATRFVSAVLIPVNVAISQQRSLLLTTRLHLSQKLTQSWVSSVAQSSSLRVISTHRSHESLDHSQSSTMISDSSLIYMRFFPQLSTDRLSRSRFRADISPLQREARSLFGQTFSEPQPMSSTSSNTRPKSKHQQAEMYQCPLNREKALSKMV